MKTPIAYRRALSTVTAALRRTARAIGAGVKRMAAVVTGGAIMAATAFAVISLTGQNGAHAILTGTLAAGLFVGACVVGAAFDDSRRALGRAIVAALVCGEIGNAGLSIESVVIKRDRDAAAHRSAVARHEAAESEMTRAQRAFDDLVRGVADRRVAAIEAARTAYAAAQRGAIEQAALPGCKDRCKALLDAGVASTREDLASAERAARSPAEADPSVAPARHALDQARAVFVANPRPATSAAPLADALHVPAWLVDIAFAVALAIGGNGLAALLVAYGAHGRHSASRADGAPAGAAEAVRRSARAGAVTAHSLPNPDTIPPAELDDLRRIFSEPRNALQAPVRSNGSANRSQIEAYVLTELAFGRAIPSQNGVAERFGVAKSTVSELFADMERRGVIVRHREGRRNVSTRGRESAQCVRPLA